MQAATARYSDLLPPTSAEAARRIEDWFRRGYVMFSDIVTRSTHLRPVEGERIHRAKLGKQ